MIVNLNLPKFKKAILLFFFLLSFSNINAAAVTFYLRTSGGDWNAVSTWSTSTGGAVATNTANRVPTTGDTVIYNGTTANVPLNITANAACLDFRNESAATTTGTITITISAGVTLNVSGKFNITGSTGFSRGTTITGTGTLTALNINVGGVLAGGVITPTFVGTRTNIMSFTGPNITVSGNVNLFSGVSGSTKFIASMISHTAGALTLSGNTTNGGSPGTGTSGSGYLNTFQNATGLSEGNRYSISGTSASIVFNHNTDCPVYSQLAATTSPSFGTDSTVKYSAAATSPTSSLIYGTNYSKLYLNNSAGYTTNAQTSVFKQMDIIAGNLAIGANFIVGSSGTEANINISSGGGVTATSGTFSYSNYVNLNYSGAVTAAGIELVSGTSVNNLSTLLKTVTISGTSGFNLGTADLIVLKEINIADTNFTCSLNSIKCPTISINGGTTNSLTIYSNLSSVINATTVNFNNLVDTNGDPIYTDLYSGNGITIQGKSITLNGTVSATGNRTSGVANTITINGTTSLLFYKNIVGEGIVTLNAPSTADTGISITGEKIIVTGNSTLNSLTATGSGGISLTGTLNLNGPLNAPTSSLIPGAITINGTTTTSAEAIISGYTISLTGDSSTYNGNITGNSIVVNGNSTFYNITATGAAGISITGTTNLNGALSTPTSTLIPGVININGTTTASADSSLSAFTIYLAGNSSVYDGTITAIGSSTGLNVSGSTTFNNTITSNRILVAASGTGTNFNSTLVDINYLTINSAANILMDQNIGNTLYLAANLSNTGIITVPNLAVSANSTLAAADVTGQIKVSNLLSVTSGILTTGGELTLVSNGTSTARVGQVAAGAITGDVTVERYLSNARRNWRLLTIPVKGTSLNSIYDNWQNGGIADDNSGTDVWGPVNTYSPETTGTYYLSPSTHNIRKYNNGWTSVGDTFNEPLFNANKNNAFLAFVIKPFGQGINVGGGASGENIFVEGSYRTTLRAKGNLLTGTQTYSTPSNIFYLIGNPYASPIDFTNLISATGVNGNTVTPKIWLIDPKLGDFGNYISWDPVNHYSSQSSQYTTSYNTLIQSGQGFFVKGKSGATSSSFVISETDKKSNTNTNIFGKNSTINYEHLRVSLDKIENSVDTNKDACVVGFYEGASNTVDDNDVQKFSNPGETLAFLNGSTSLSSEHRAPIVDGDVLFIKLSQATANNYKLKIYTEDFIFAGSAYLYDLKLGTNVPLPLDGTVFEYPFDVTSDATTQGTRFKIVFSTALGTVKNNNPYAIVAYPSPASTNVTLNLGTLELGNYNYKIINLLGQEMQNGTIENQGLNQEFKINFNSSLKSGWYSIQISNQNTPIYTLPILIK